MYNASHLQIKSLKIEYDKPVKKKPCRWVRYITQTSSYVCRT